MRLKKVEKREKQGRVRGPLAKLSSPDSGQVEKALGPLRLIERCSKRRQCERDGVGWSFGVHGRKLCG